MYYIKFIQESMHKGNVGIYKITNMINNKVYIGQTKESFQRRYWLHRWKLRNNSHDNSHLQRSWNKYGEDNFVFEAIEVFNEKNISLIDEREKFWIEHYRKLPTGSYNIQDGGQPKNLNTYISPEARKRVGELNRRRMLGSKLSKETRRKMSESRKGKKPPIYNDSLSEEKIVKIKSLLVNGYSSREIMNILDVEYKPINAILSNNTYAYYGVPGWDEFRKSHLKKAQIKKEQSAKLHEDILTLHRQGTSKSEISKRLNVARQTVNYHLKKELLC